MSSWSQSFSAGRFNRNDFILSYIIPVLAGLVSRSPPLRAALVVAWLAIQHLYFNNPQSFN